MSEEHRRRDLRAASDRVPPSELDIEGLLHSVRRRLILETAGVTLILVTVCALFGWLAVTVRGAIWHQEPLQGLLGPRPAPHVIGSDLIIGIPLSITGQQSREGAFAKQGYDMWLDWINSQGGIIVSGVKHRVKAIYKD